MNIMAVEISLIHSVKMICIPIMKVLAVSLVFLVLSLVDSKPVINSATYRYFKTRKMRRKQRERKRNLKRKNSTILYSKVKVKNQVISNVGHALKTHTMVSSTNMPTS